MNELTGLFNALNKGADIVKEQMRNQHFADEVIAKEKKVSPKKLKLAKARARLDESRRIALLAQEDSMPKQFVLWLEDIARENREIVDHITNG